MMKLRDIDYLFVGKRRYKAVKKDTHELVDEFLYDCQPEEVRKLIELIGMGAEAYLITVIDGVLTVYVLVD